MLKYFLLGVGMEIKQIVSPLLDSNVFLLSKNGQALIVDAGVELERIKPLLGGKKVEGVLLTHGHYDHSLYAKEYAEAFGCKVFALKEIKDILGDGQANYSEGKFVLKDFSNFVFVEDGVQLQLGEFEVDVFETAGHSKDSACFLIGGQLFAGDTIFAQGIGRTDLISSDAKNLLKSLEKIEKIAYENVYSGHGNSSNKRQQSFNIRYFKSYLKKLLGEK